MEIAAVAETCGAAPLDLSEERAELAVDRGEVGIVRILLPDLARDAVRFDAIVARDGEAEVAERVLARVEIVAVRECAVELVGRRGRSCG